MITDFSEFLPAVAGIKIVDVGANPLYGNPPYQYLLDTGRATVIGFEPEKEAYEALLSRNNSCEKYLPYVIGDGNATSFYSCPHPGMSSIYQPDMDQTMRKLQTHGTPDPAAG